MPKSVSPAALRSLFEQHTSGEWLILLTISHPEFSTLFGGPIYVVLRDTDVRSRLRTFKASYFEAHLPAQDENSFPTVQLSVQNIDQAMVEAVRTIQTPASVKLEMALASQPDIIEFESSEFTLTNVTWDAQFVKGTLTYDFFLDEPFPGDYITPANFPGGF